MRLFLPAGIDGLEHSFRLHPEFLFEHTFLAYSPQHQHRYCLFIRFDHNLAIILHPSREAAKAVRSLPAQKAVLSLSAAVFFWGPLVFFGELFPPWFFLEV